MLNDIAKLVSLAKRRGFIFASSEIYGGLSSIWDYGPLGAELKNNLKRRWWKDVVYARDDVEGLDAAILMHPNVWKASGHVKGFFDEFADCKSCKKRFRCDELASGRTKPGAAFKCPECGSSDIAPPRRSYPAPVGSLVNHHPLPLVKIRLHAGLKNLVGLDDR